MTIPRHGSAVTSLPKDKATSRNDLFVIGGENEAPGKLVNSEAYSSKGELTNFTAPKLEATSKGTWL